MTFITYTLRNAFALLLLCSLSFPSFAQSFQLFQPVADKAAAAPLIGKELTEYGLLEIDAEDYSQLLANAPTSWSLQIPAVAGMTSELTLQLERNDFLRPDFRLRRASDGQAVPAPNLGLHFTGTVAGASGSKVALSLLDGELTATITYAGGERFALGKVQNQSEKSAAATYLLFPDRQLAEGQEFDCGTADSGVPYSAKELDQMAGEKAAGGCVDVYFEIDYDVFADKGSVAGAAQHLAANFNEVALTAFG